MAELTINTADIAAAIQKNLDVVDLAEDHRTDGLLVEVQGEAERATLELEQLVDCSVGQARHTGDAVADLEDPPDLGLFQARGKPVEVLADRFGDVIFF